MRESKPTESQGEDQNPSSLASAMSSPSGSFPSGRPEGSSHHFFCDKKPSKHLWPTSKMAHANRVSRTLDLLMVRGSGYFLNDLECLSLTGVL